MIYEVHRTWLRRRWKVYQVGHLIGDEQWLATFRSKRDAFHFAGITRGTEGNVFGELTASSEERS